MKWGVKRGGTCRTLCAGVIMSCLTIGCGTHAAPAKAVAPVEHVPESAGPVAKPAQVPVPPLPAEWTTGLAVACEWTSWPVTEEKIPLRTSTAVRAFATIETPSRVRLPVGDASQGLEIRAEVDGFVVNGVVLATEIALYPAKALPVARDQTVIPTSATPFHYLRSSVGQVDLEIELPSSVKVAHSQRQFHYQCTELGVSERLFDSPASIGSLSTKRKDPLRLTASPNGKVSAEVEASDWCDSFGECVVNLVESRGAYRKVFLEYGTFRIVGWVRRDRFDEANEFGLIGLLNTGSSGMPRQPFDGSVRPPDAPADSICAWNAPLILEDQGVRRIQGSVLANTPLERISTRDGFVEILPPKALASPADVRWFVPEAYIYSCGEKE